MNRHFAWLLDARTAGKLQNTRAVCDGTFLLIYCVAIPIRISPWLSLAEHEL
jgi:hypothetical protein